MANIVEAAHSLKQQNNDLVEENRKPKARLIEYSARNAEL